MNGTTPTARQANDFRFDTRNIEWKDFLTEGCYYRILDVNVAARTADMLVKFDPGSRCLFPPPRRCDNNSSARRLTARFRTKSRWWRRREN
jgi:hypothetical protein